MTQPLYVAATVTVIRGRMERFIRKDSGVMGAAGEVERWGRATAA